jgi:lysophospholipase L1-like esterase
MEITYLALGDSYTIGESVPEEGRWSVQLAELLKESGLSVQPVEIIAKTGWTTDELAEAIDTSNVTPTYSLVSLLIGVNNQYRGRPVDNFRKEFRELLDTAIRFAGNDPARVFVVSIPDWGVSPFASGRDRDKIASEIDEYNRVKEEESLKKGILFINITDISRNTETGAELFASDGLHPSAEQYKLWVDRISPQVQDLLEKWYAQ